MNTTYFYTIVGQTYGAGGYDSSAYGVTNTTTTTTGGSTGSNSAGGNVLTNTGVVIIGIVTLAAIIALTAMVVRLWRRPSRKNTSS